MGHFEDLEDLDLKTSVSVLGIRPGPWSELKTLDRLLWTRLSKSGAWFVTRTSSYWVRQNLHLQTAICSFLSFKLCVLCHIPYRSEEKGEAEGAKSARKLHRKVANDPIWSTMVIQVWTTQLIHFYILSLLFPFKLTGSQRRSAAQIAVGPPSGKAVCGNDG